MAVPFNSVNATTREAFMPKVYDNIFKSLLLFGRFKKRNTYSPQNGGKYLLVPVLYDSVDANAEWIVSTDTYTNNTSDEFTAAQYFWKYSHSSITLSDMDELENSGPEIQVINIVKARVQRAEMTLKKLLGTALFNDGTNAKAMAGLKAGILDTNVYAAIDRTANTWWAANVDSATTVQGLPAMQSMYGLCTIADEMPTLILGQQNQTDRYWAALQNQQRFGSGNTINAGAKNLLLNSTPVVVDPNAQANYLYFLNENFMLLRYHPRNDFLYRPFARKEDTPLNKAHITWSGNLAIMNSALQGVMTAVAA